MFAITYRKVWLIIAAVIMIGSALIIGLFGLKQGIDFTGGSLTEVVYESAPTKEALEAGISTLALGGT